ncbi:tyrosine protein phosphatase [Streptomyces sp. NPDC053427]|uniref:protein-tyrosine phosphatase family protein n=1 Tax=Streptomyces sp. NPDC053427 TaxID=3365701 RepID=UPI0037D7730F
MTEPSSPVLYTVAGPRGPGRLSTMARPRGHGHLAGDMAALRGAGADVVVSALPAAERAQLGLADEPQLAETAGLRFVALPIPDFTVPSIPAVLPVLRDLAEELRAGAHVVAHCRCAIGRSSLIAVSLMILEGITPETAWTAMERARGARVPDTEEQRAWTLDFFRFVFPWRAAPDRNRAAGPPDPPTTRIAPNTVTGAARTCPEGTDAGPNGSQIRA